MAEQAGASAGTGSSKLRVAIVTRFFSPRLAGAEASVARLAHYVASTGATCEVVTTRFVDGLSRREAARDGVRIRRLSTAGRGLARPIEFIRAMLYFLVNGHRFDVVETVCLSPFALGALLGAQARGTRTIIQPCTVGPDGDIAKVRAYPGGDRLWRLFLRADSIVARGDLVAADLRIHGAPTEKVTVIAGMAFAGPAGSPDAGTRAAARLSLGLPNRTTVLYVGRLEPAKGVDLLLDVWPRVTARHEATLLLVGDGPLRARAVETAASIGFPDAVRAVGWQTDPRPWYEASDIFAFPSRSESFGLAAADAMAYELPIVVTPTGLTRPWVAGPADGALIVPDGDTDALFAALDELLADEGRRRALGVRARQRAELSFSEDVVGGSYVSLYERLRSTTAPGRADRAIERES
jgi:glycosyltransferase involved in cell wall biosynthesis